MATDFKYDVFLSHNKADKPRVRRLAEGILNDIRFSSGLQRPDRVALRQK